MEKITIILVDDHKLVRQTWSFILTSDPRFNVICECDSGEDAIEKVAALQPDIVIMDINLPGISGIDATDQITKLGSKTKVLGVSLHASPNYVQRIMEKGAMGYVIKSSSKEEMFEAITEVHKGNKYICKGIKIV